MAEHHHQHTELTKNQSLVFKTLSGADGPLSAYTILDQLREDGFRAPLQVYRALDKLVEFGIVHRLESLNAFVACSQPDCETHETVAFTICDSCKAVTEISDEALESRLNKLAVEAEFALKRTTIELRGTCVACTSK